MHETVAAVPPRLQEIIEEFTWCEGREKLELLLEFAEKLPPLPEHLHRQRDAMEPVPECMTSVFIHAEANDGRLTFDFEVPPESPTVRGYAEILRDGTAGAKAEEVLAIPKDFYLRMDLQQVLTPQRLNGISAILAHMKRLAVRELEKSA